MKKIKFTDNNVKMLYENPAPWQVFSIRNKEKRKKLIASYFDITVEEVEEIISKGN